VDWSESKEKKPNSEESDKRRNCKNETGSEGKGKVKTGKDGGKTGAK